MAAWIRGRYAGRVEPIDRSIQDSASRGSYVGLAAFVVWALIAALKSDRIPIDIPARARPFIALVLGQIYGVLEAVVGGMAWRSAIIRGIIVAAVAIAGQEWGSKLRKPGSGPPSTPPPMVFVLALVLAGCGAQKAQLESALEAARDVSAVAHPCLVAQQEQAIEQCADEACKAKVRESFEPIAKAFDLLNELWCGLSPESEGCK